MPRQKKTRRGNNEGSIFQRKNGQWVGEVTVGYKPDGKRKYKTFYGKTREEVARKVTKATNDVFNGLMPIDSSKVTVEQLIMEWLMKYKRVSVTARTLEFYLSISKAIIFPAIGSVPIQKLTANQIQNVITDLSIKQSKSYRTVKAFRDTLRQALNWAIDLNLIVTNPAEKTNLPKNDRNPEKESAKAIPVSLRATILQAAENDTIMKPAILTLMFLGLRSAELLALRWKDVNFDDGSVTILNAISIRPDFDDFGNHTKRQTVVTSPKTVAGYRTLQAPPMVIDALKEWKSYIDAKKPEHSDFVFCSTKSGNMRTYNAFRTSYRNFLKRNDLDGYNISLHSYRHTFATLLLEKNVNPKIVSKLLGHADISITLGTYSHVMKEVYGCVADTLSDIYVDTMVGSYKPQSTVTVNVQ